jgi:hypothetical protein
MGFDIEREIPPTAMVDAEQAAAIAHVPPRLVRAHFNSMGLPPAGTYRGEPLWLADDIHRVVAA